VPTPTAVAPAMMNSSASVAVMMPPWPMMGMRCGRATSYTWWTLSSAIGLIAGPDRPPCTLPITGRRSSTSIAMPMMVLITASASEPASMQRRAFSRMSVWLGDSLVMSGFLVTRRQAATTWADMSG
jgi:hypothetical protein